MGRKEHLLRERGRTKRVQLEAQGSAKTRPASISSILLMPSRQCVRAVPVSTGSTHMLAAEDESSHIFPEPHRALA